MSQDEEYEDDYEDDEYEDDFEVEPGAAEMDTPKSSSAKSNYGFESSHSVLQVKLSCLKFALNVTLYLFERPLSACYFFVSLLLFLFLLILITQ